MISVEKALQVVLNTTQDFGVEQLPFIKASGRILKEEIFADRDFPPFNRVSMDGIAIDFNSFNLGQRNFFIEGIQPAGSQQTYLSSPKNCIEVMTGSVLPSNTNTVIRYEDLTIVNGTATIDITSIKNQQCVHLKGKDGRTGDLLIQENTKISAAEIGILSTVGKLYVKVAKLPKVMIISTGDELVGVDETPLIHQIRRSNVFTLVTLLEKLNIVSETAHISDDKLVLKTTIEPYLNDYDVLLFSGAVSKGKFDFLPEILNELGVDKLFHIVAQRPGKPFLFGEKKHIDEYKKSTVVFGLPGNPISTFVNCLVYFYPWFFTSNRIEIKKEMAALAEDFVFKPNLTYFLQVKLTHQLDHLIATPIFGNGSGDLASLLHADAFIQLPQGQIEFKKGEVFPIIKYR